MVQSILKKSEPAKRVGHIDTPRLSMSEYNERHRLLNEIISRNGGVLKVEPNDENQYLGALLEGIAEEDQPPPKVEITGLELLMFSDDVDASDHSFDSYAKDSFGVSCERMRHAKMDAILSSSGHYNRGGVRASRRMSNSSIGEGQSYGYGDQVMQPLSYDDFSSFADESAPYPNQKMYGLYRSNRRGSMESYANDSADFGRYKSTHRSSIGSISYRTTRRNSMESFANDSIDFGRYESTRRSSIGSSSYANDSVYRAKGGGGCGGGACRRSSMGSYANDSMKLQNLAKVKRRTSNESFYAFSKEVYDTQAINTGGVGRAA